MSIIACSVDGCDKANYCRTWCRKHYARFRRYGSPHKFKREFLHETCTVSDCNREHSARGYCDTHYQRWRKHGDPLAVAPRGGDPASRELFTGQLGYIAAHEAVHRALGKASDQNCADCPDVAAHWAYDHSDPEEITLSGTGSAYSVNPSFYKPLCPSCHKLYDTAFRGEEEIKEFIPTVAA